MQSYLHGITEMGETLDTLSRIHSITAKFDHFSDQLIDYGFTDVFYGRLGLGSGEPIVMTRWNKEWSELYSARRFETVDWALKTGKRSDGPFVFSEPSEIITRHEKEFAKAANAYNRLNGFAVPFRVSGQPIAGFSATGLDRRPSEGVVFALAAMGYVLNLSISGQLAADVCKATEVTPRQVNLLRLLGDGLTHVEIAHVLGISEDWAHKSFARLREKFSVRTDAALIKHVMEIGLLT